MSDEEKKSLEVEETQEEINEEPVQEEEIKEEAPQEETPVEESVEAETAVEDIQEEPAKEDEVPAKKKKKRIRRKDMTPEQKKKRRIKDIIISVAVIGTVGILLAIFAIAGYAGNKTNRKMITQLEKVGTTYQMGENLKLEQYGDASYYTFTTPTISSEFKVLQLTDIHIGAGAFCISNDNWAINAVAKMVKDVKPDLVIVTGDIGYPVPFQSGTFNNLREAETFAELMEQLGVYWAHVYGNHDTELYSLYDRKELSDLVYLKKDKYPHCLFQIGPDDIAGYGNYIVNVKNPLGLITQSFVLVDSHAYTDGDYFGIAWKYDNIHQDQIDWYEKEINKLNTMNKATYATLTAAQKTEYALATAQDLAAVELKFNDPNAMTIKSSMYFHIPLTEYKDVWDEYVASGYQKVGSDYEFKMGIGGEAGKVVYCGMHDDNVFETIQKLKSTTHVFCGHDHYNNFSIEYWGKNGNKETDWGVTLTYSLSIDYLAMPGIAKKYEQRGGTIIKVSSAGDLALSQRKLIDIEQGK